MEFFRLRFCSTTIFYVPSLGYGMLHGRGWLHVNLPSGTCFYWVVEKSSLSEHNKKYVTRWVPPLYGIALNQTVLHNTKKKVTPRQGVQQILRIF